MQYTETTIVLPYIPRAPLGNELLRGQGFLARFLIAAPGTIAGTRFLEGKETPPPSERPEVGRYWQAVTSLLSGAWPIDELGALKPRRITLTPEAKRDWIRLHDAIERQLGAGGKLQEIKPMAAKAAECAARIAAVIAITECPYTEAIDAPTLDRAGQLMEFYIGEALRLTHGAAPAQEQTEAQGLIEWIRDKRPGGVTLRDICKNGPRLARSKRKADALIAVLVEHGHLVPTGTGWRPACSA